MFGPYSFMARSGVSSLQGMSSAAGETGRRFDLVAVSSPPCRVAGGKIAVTFEQTSRAIDEHSHDIGVAGMALRFCRDMSVVVAGLSRARVSSAMSASSCLFRG
jgi:hypothetical protein